MTQDYTILMLKMGCAIGFSFALGIMNTCVCYLGGENCFWLKVRDL